MNVGDLVKHKNQGVVGLVTKTYDGLGICYVEWACPMFKAPNHRVSCNSVEVVYESW